MANISLLRVDDRLVHGQVVTKWIHESGAEKIIIVDDYLATNSYLSNVFKLAAPKGIDVATYSSEKFVDEINANTFGDTPLLVLFKTIKNLKKVFDLGFSVERIQIGGIGSNADRKLVYQSIALSEEEAKDLLEIQKNNVAIFFQRVPDEKEADLSVIVKKNFKNLI
ncbi:PTS sugar transporter subunit IIB [Lactobacillus sp. ESL0791]|uniref:PTS sugar transporter subunit IIB n=1 Tax=Lactobacillus sp. ESL0791 TaxID=2983234 RepID=UPI0023F7F793|nr:PTS sugar transporter subunit IIB [Lactobacillus sp. ESL0791]MDF7639756.1 PTS sugar transporter subunit IIB [Lactobacillus sp. ESL0791]